MTSDHGRSLDVERRRRSDHSMLKGKVRPDSGSGDRLTHAGHGLPQFSSPSSNSGSVGSRGGRTLPKEGLVWSVTSGMSVEWPSKECRMTEERAVVFVIDDDAATRDALESLVRSVGLEVHSFGSTGEFLQSKRPDAPGCLVLDVRLPGASGLDFQHELASSDIHLPIIFITGYGDIPMSVRAMKAGAIEFLSKPFRGQDLLDAIRQAIERSGARRHDAAVIAGLQGCYESLTTREREVMALVVTGRLNKQIAADLNVSEVTVKVHRGQVMRKMQTRSLAELVRMADKLGISAPNS
jgi:FixJ family two-component response regulator